MKLHVDNDNNKKFVTTSLKLSKTNNEHQKGAAKTADWKAITGDR
jgi:hypothetical protein